MKRYIKEFVNDEIRRLNENTLITPNIRNEIISDMHNIMKTCENGYIAEFEALYLITKRYFS